MAFYHDGVLDLDSEEAQVALARAIPVFGEPDWKVGVYADDDLMWQAGKAFFVKTVMDSGSAYYMALIFATEIEAKAHLVKCLTWNPDLSED